MITRDNFEAVKATLWDKDKRRMINTVKDYIALELCVFNAGGIVLVTCTNNYDVVQRIIKAGGFGGDKEDVLRELGLGEYATC